MVHLLLTYFKYKEMQRDTVHSPLVTCTSATLNWKQTHWEGGWTTVKQWPADIWQRMRAKSWWRSFTQTVCNLPPLYLNQWDTQLTFQRGPRMTLQTSKWPTSVCWSICGVCVCIIKTLSFSSDRIKNISCLDQMYGSWLWHMCYVCIQELKCGTRGQDWKRLRMHTQRTQTGRY